MSARGAGAPIRVAFVLAELTLGGAEMMLWKLLSRLDRSRFDPLVVALSSRVDGMIELFDRIGARYRLLGMNSRTDPLAMCRLIGVLREFEPDIIQGWMYHGNLAATMVVPWVPRRPPVIWNIRGTLNLKQEKPLSVLAIRLGAKLSVVPRKIINNSLESAIEHEQRLGYAESKRVILPNGFDTGVFRPSTEARAALRAELGLAADSLLIGLIGRYHPMKDHETFLRAATLVNAKWPHAYFVLAGENVDPSNDELRGLVTSLGLCERAHFLGIRSDMPSLTAALDICVSSSSGGEGFPNVVGEAMSCGVPCVVTDVGGSRRIIGDTGTCVPARDPQALARGITDLIQAGADGRRELGVKARQRVIDHFGLSTVVRQYEDLYVQVYAHGLGNERA